MSKLRILLVISLVIVGVLIGRVLVWPMVGGGQKYTEVFTENLLETRNGWILQYDIMNREGEDQKYTINVSIDGKIDALDVSIRDKKRFTYIKHISPSMFTSETGEVSITICKNGDATPFEQGTWYLKKPTSTSQ